MTADGYDEPGKDDEDYTKQCEGCGEHVELTAGMCDGCLEIA